MTYRKILTAASVAALVAGFAGTVMAASGNGSAAAKLLTPITVTQSSALNFGTVAADGAAASSVVMDSAGVRTVGTGSPTLVTDAANPPTGGAFNLTGGASLAYSVTAPVAAIQLNDAAQPLLTTWPTVDTFVVTTPGTFDGTGAATAQVGATLNLPTAQPAGNYTGSYIIVVNYP